MCRIITRQSLLGRFVLSQRRREQLPVCLSDFLAGCGGFVVGFASRLLVCATRKPQRCADDFASSSSLWVKRQPSPNSGRANSDRSAVGVSLPSLPAESAAHWQSAIEKRSAVSADGNRSPIHQRLRSAAPSIRGISLAIGASIKRVPLSLATSSHRFVARSSVCPAARSRIEPRR